MTVLIIEDDETRAWLAERGLELFLEKRGIVETEKEGDRRAFRVASGLPSENASIVLRSIASQMHEKFGAAFIADVAVPDPERCRMDYTNHIGVFYVDNVQYESQ